MGKFTTARGLYREAIGLLKALGPWSPPSEDLRIELATALDDAGENLRMSGKPREAEAEYLEGLETLKRPADPPGAEGPGRIAEARLQLDLSGTLTETGQFDRAKLASRRAIDLLKPGADSPGADRADRLLLIYALMSRAGTLRLNDELEAASAELSDAARRARELMAAIPDPDTKFALACLRNEQGLLLMVVAAPDGAGDQALKAFHEAYTLLEPLYRSQSRITEYQRAVSLTLNGRSACYLALKKIKEAKADGHMARRLLERLDSSFPGHYSYQSQLGWAATNLSRIARAEGIPDARDLLLKAITHHSAALTANRDSPVDKKLLAICREELSQLGEGTAPRP